MRHSKLVGTVSNPDLSGQAVSTYHGPYAVRLKTAPTPIISLQVYPDVSGIYRGDRNRPAPIISLQVPIYRDARRVGIYPEYRGFIGGIEDKGRKCSFIFGIHYKYGDINYDIRKW